MKVATWNIERLKHHNSLDQITQCCENVGADVLVLAETDKRVCPAYKFCLETLPLPEGQPPYYKATERRVSIFTNYPVVRQHTTFDAQTALCVELETELGNLLVYGTIIGTYGNRHPTFMQDLSRQLEDFRRLTSQHESLCVCGDFNCSFADNYYYTKSGRAAILQSLKDNRLCLLTEGRAECIDHIALSDKLALSATVEIEEWNSDKSLSDHKGIAAKLLPQ